LYNQNQSKLVWKSIGFPAAVRIQEGIGFGMGLLQAGFTSVRDLGNSGQYLDLHLKKIFERQKPSTNVVYLVLSFLLPRAV
jgi:hypothetical protein